MTTELVILLMLFVIIIAGVIKTPATTFEEAGPRLGMRIEKHLETGADFTYKTQRSAAPISWEPKK